jgi:hypothetical protein
VRGHMMMPLSKAPPGESTKSVCPLKLLTSAAPVTVPRAQAPDGAVGRPIVVWGCAPFIVPDNHFQSGTKAQYPKGRLRGSATIRLADAPQMKTGSAIDITLL